MKKYAWQWDRESGKVIDAHITLRVFTKHCLICYGFSHPLSVSCPTCLTLFMWLSSGLTTCHASWPVIKHCVMIQSQIYLHCAAGSCHLACFRNQITFQGLLHVYAPLPHPPSHHFFAVSQIFLVEEKRKVTFPNTDFGWILNCGKTNCTLKAHQSIFCVLKIHNVSLKQLLWTRGKSRQLGKHSSWWDKEKSISQMFN